MPSINVDTPFHRVEIKSIAYTSLLTLSAYVDKLSILKGYR